MADSRVAESTVTIAVLAPDLLGTYGDIGNALVLERRLAWRGLSAEVLGVNPGAGVPETADIYLLGGGEDAEQTLATTELVRSTALGRAVDRGAVVFAVCAGFQILGHRYPAAGTERPGLGLLDVDSMRTKDSRAVGELLADPIAASVGGAELGPLTGFENHAARTRLGPAARPLAAVVRGVGNGFDNLEGAVQGRVVGTYLHGPALARNPALADLLLSWVVGELTPLALEEVDQLRRERLIGQTGALALKGRSRTRAWRNWQTRWT